VWWTLRVAGAAASLALVDQPTAGIFRDGQQLDVWAEARPSAGAGLFGRPALDLHDSVCLRKVHGGLFANATEKTRMHSCGARRSGPVGLPGWLDSRRTSSTLMAACPRRGQLCVNNLMPLSQPDAEWTALYLGDASPKVFVYDTTMSAGHAPRPAASRPCDGG